MRALTYLGPGRAEFQDVAAPRLTGPSDALVEPLAVARCDSDAALLAGRVPLDGPFPLGHEFAGRVLAVGDEVTVAGPDDEVVAPFQISCGTCARCERGLTATCRGVQAGAMYGFGTLGGDQWGGAFSEVVRVPYANHLLVKVPPGVSLAQAATAADGLADAWRAVGPHLAAEPGASVLVVGGGCPSVGLWAAELAGLLGAGHVAYLDTDPGRLALAEAAGAEPIAGPPPHRLADHCITVDASADRAGLACAIRSTAPNHRCTSVSIYWSDPPVPFLHMYARNVSLDTGRVHSRQVLPITLELIAASVIDPLRIATLTDWDDIDGWVGSPAPRAIAVRRPAAQR